MSKRPRKPAAKRSPSSTSGPIAMKKGLGKEPTLEQQARALRDARTLASDLARTWVESLHDFDTFRYPEEEFINQMEGVREAFVWARRKLFFEQVTSEHVRIREEACCEAGFYFGLEIGRRLGGGAG